MRWLASCALLAISAEALAMPGTVALGVAGADEGTQAAMLADGGIVVSGASRGSAPFADSSWIACLDLQALRWTRSLPLLRDARVASLPDGGFAVAGIVRASATVPVDAAWIGRFDAAGNLTGSQDQRLGDVASGEALAVGDDLGAWLSFVDLMGSDGVVRFDLAGTEAPRALRIQGANWTPGHAFTPLPDGSVVLPSNSELVRVLPSGAVSWRMRCPSGIRLWHATGPSPRGITAAGEVSTGSAAEAVLADIDLSGSVAGAVRLSGRSLAGLRASVAADGTVALACAATAGAVDVVAHARVLPDRTLAWFKGLAPSREISVTSVLPQAGGGGILIGDVSVLDLPGAGTASHPESDAWLAVSDAAGTLPLGCAGQPMDLGASILPWPVAMQPQAVTVEPIPPEAANVLVAPAPSALGISSQCAPTGCSEDISDASSCGVARLDASFTDLRFCADAEDWFDLTACSGGVHVLWTENLSPGVDTVLEIWSPDCGTLLASDDDGGGGLASRLAFVAPEDATYRLVVRQKDGRFGPGLACSLRADRPACSPAWKRALASDVEPSYQSDPFDVASDGATIVAARRILAETDLVASATRLDADGQVTWAAMHDILAPDRAWYDEVAAIPGSDAVLLGGTRLSEGNASRALITQVTAGGLIQRGVELASAAAVGLQVKGLAIDAADTSSVRAWGAAGNSGSFLASANLVSRSVRWSLATPRPVIDAVALSDGGAFALLGQGTGTAAGPSASLARIAGDGSLTWERDAWDPAGTTLEAAGLAPLADGSVVMILRGESVLHLLTIAGDGSLVDARESAAFHAARVEVDAAPGFGACILGRAEDGADVFETHVVRVGADGALVHANAMRDGGNLRIACGSEGMVLARGNEYTRLDRAGRLPLRCSPTRPLDLAPAPSALVLSDATRASFAPDTLTARSGSLIARHVGGRSVLRCTTGPCEPVIADIRAVTPALPCDTATITLSATGTGQAPLRYEWDFDYDGTSFDVEATGADAFLTAPAGTRTVAVRVTDSCPWGPGSAIATRVLDVAGGTPVAITGAAAWCPGEPCVVLSATPGFSAYRWDTGSSAEQICVSPSRDTVHVVTATDAGGCVSSASHAVRSTGTWPLAVSIEERCAGSALQLVAILDGGMPPHDILWSTGETTAIIDAAPGPRDVVVTDGLGCTARASVVASLRCDEPPGEVSEPGEPPLRLAGDAPTTLIFHEEPAAMDYNLVIGRIGSPVSDGALSSCHLTGWTDLGSGRLALEATLEPGTWVVVTASNRAGEGSAGTGTRGGERSARPGWFACGASP